LYKKLQTHRHNNTGSVKNGDESQFSHVSRLITDPEALAVSISALCPTDLVEKNKQIKNK
jgi:hypothetical protein